MPPLKHPDASPPPSGPPSAWKLAALGRWTLLFLLAGHLLLRQAFAHLNLTMLIQLALNQALPTEATPRPDWIPAIFDSAYVTELILLALLPLAIHVWRTRERQVMDVAPGQDYSARMLGLPTLIAVAFLAWGAGHALLAVLFPGRVQPDLPTGFALHEPRDWYLIFRQSALGAYALVFVYAFLFFRGKPRYIASAVAAGIFVSVGCAAADVMHLLGPETIDGTLFGQETLALAILAAFVVMAHYNNILARGAAVIVLAFAGWRQSFRFQSGVPISIAGAILLYAALGMFASARGQSRTLKRAAACLFLLCVLGVGYAFLKKPAKNVSTKVDAWSPGIYAKLLKTYHDTEAPSDPAQYAFSRRPPFVQVSDPEVYKLEAVYDTSAAVSISVADNIWRLLVWRRKASDWLYGHPIVGAGVGFPWFYEALYHARFYYGQPREGLDPHNSFLNLLYRYGLIGFGLFVALIALVLASAVRALRPRIQGDGLLEGLCVYFFYTAVFAFFNNALEGPSYALPFWMSLGLVYARAWQLNHRLIVDEP